MANVLTSERTYASYNNAVKALDKVLTAATGMTTRSGRPLSLDTARWLIGVSPSDRRFVPTLLGAEYAPFAHAGIMVIA